MRLRYLFDGLIPSTETDTEQVLNTVAAMARRGIDVELVVPADEAAPPSADAIREYYQVEGAFRLTGLPRRLSRSRPLEKTAHGVRGAALPGDFDVLYTRNLPALAAGLARGRRVAYEHFRPWADQYPALRPPLRALMRHPRFLGAVLHSEHTLESYARLGVSRARLLTAHNGYDPKKILPTLDRREARRELGHPDGRALVVYTGHVNELKGLDVVLEMARRCPDVDFMLVGSVGEGPVERRAASLDNVHVVARQPFDRLRVFLYAADILIIPPSLEPLERHGNTVLPMKLFAYLAAGRVVLAPEAPDTAELLRHDENAVLVPAGSASGAAKAVKELLADPERARRLSEAAAGTARALTWDARAEKIETFLDERLG